MDVMFIELLNIIDKYDPEAFMIYNSVIFCIKTIFIHNYKFNKQIKLYFRNYDIKLS